MNKRWKCAEISCGGQLNRLNMNTRLQQKLNHVRENFLQWCWDTVYYIISAFISALMMLFDLTRPVSKQFFYFSFIIYIALPALWYPVFFSQDHLKGPSFLKIWCDDDDDDERMITEGKVTTEFNVKINCHQKWTRTTYMSSSIRFKS